MDADTHTNAEGGTENETDWGRVVKRIQERMYLNQEEIADRCNVARQTVSAWLHHRRNPGFYTKRKLRALAAEAGLGDEMFSLEGKQGGLPEDDAAQLLLLLKQLSPDAREEVLEFARFKVFRERG